MVMSDEPKMPFKPNIYPIMYWALAYGVICGLVLFVVWLLTRFITVIWFPVFLVGLIWGAYRNYQKQKGEWHKYSGMPTAPLTPVQEFKQAARDIFAASQTMMAEQAAEDADLAAQGEQTFTQEEVLNEEPPAPEEPLQEPPAPPTSPPIPPRTV